MAESAQSWYWCTKHNTVEPYRGCAERYRIGPFASRAEAEHALEIIREREERKRVEDEEWHGERGSQA